MCNGCCDTDRCQSCGTGRSIKKTPHKHAELIKVWADGVAIQVKRKMGGMRGRWVDCPYPNWYNDYEYRVKPEPKPDVVKYCYVNKGCVSQFGPVKDRIDNVKFTFDGETGNLKSVEMI